MASLQEPVIATFGQQVGEWIVPLPSLQTFTICAPSVALANIGHAFTLPNPWFKMAARERTQPISICGSGPSLADTYKDICGRVLACNSAIGFLHNHGVKVHSAMLWDADPRVAQFVHLIDGCTYFVASRCDPGVTAALAGMNIVLWHANGDKDLQAYVEEHTTQERQKSPLINGGSAAVTRAIYLAYAMGYRDMHLHGADSSYREGSISHVNGSLVEQNDDMRVMCGLKWYDTNRWLIAQAQEFAAIYKPLTTFMGAKVTVHGDGLIPYIWSELRAAG